MQKVHQDSWWFIEPNINLKNDAYRTLVAYDNSYILLWWIWTEWWDEEYYCHVDIVTSSCAYNISTT